MLLFAGIPLAVLAWSPWTPPASQCLLPNGTLAPCKPGNEVCNGPFGRNTPQFHVRDLSCGVNDPVSPVYDPVHGVYHVHYENHIGLNGHYTHGHAVSRDFVHWAHLPIDIWNDQPYDEASIYTGSATVVGGQVIQVYPGLCDVKKSSCPGGTNLCIAVPANASDPLQRSWSKTWITNPIVNNTQRDPSTAWQTAHGEWRFTTYDAVVYGSMDFKTWYSNGKAPGFQVAECPSMFPLPRATANASQSLRFGRQQPTHVYKTSHSGADWMTVGTYTDGPVKTPGSFTPSAGLTEVRIDQGAFYASKDFYDPVKNRRILWGWAKVHPASTLSLPREVTWHAELEQLVFSPVEEQDQLRGDILGRLSKQLLSPSRPVLPLNLPKWVGNTSDVLVTFDRPSTTVELGVRVMVDGSPNSGTLFSMEYTHSPANISTVIVRGGVYSDKVQLLPSDRSIDLRLLVDNTMTEAFWMGGRVAMTVDTPATEEADVHVSIAGNSTATVSVTACVWSVKSIWVTPDEVLKTERRDRQPVQASKYIV